MDTVYRMTIDKLKVKCAGTFTFIISGCSKDTCRFPIPNYNNIDVNDSSMILSELWQIGTNSIQFIHEIHSKMLQIHPFSHLPHLFQTYLANQLQSSVSYLMLLEHQRAALIFNEMNKNQSFTCVIVFPLPLRRQLKRLSMPSEQWSKLKFFSTLFWWQRERIYS